MLFARVFLTSETKAIVIANKYPYYYRVGSRITDLVCASKFPCPHETNLLEDLCDDSSQARFSQLLGRYCTSNS